MRRIRLVGAAGIAGTVAAVALSGAITTAGATSVVGCSTSQLTGKFALIKGSNGAGNVEYRLTLTNHAHACAVDSHPGLKLLDKHGNALPTHVVSAGRSGLVDLAGGASKSLRVRFSPDVPGPGESSTHACEKTAYKIEITPLHGHGSLTAAVSPPTPVCEHGRLSEESAL